MVGVWSGRRKKRERGKFGRVREESNRKRGGPAL